MHEPELTLWEWLVRKWETPLFQRAVRFLAAAILGAAGVYYLVQDAGSGNWILLFLGAAFFLVLGLRIELPEKRLPVIPEEVPPKGETVARPVQPAAISEPAAASELQIAPEETAGAGLEPMPEPSAAIGPASVPAPSAARAPEAPAPAPRTIGCMSLVRIPLALILALSAQWVMDTRPIGTEDARLLGWALYGFAFLILGWALFSGDAVFSIDSPLGIGNGIRFNRQRLWLLAGAVLFGGLVYIGSSGGLFRPMALLTLAIALAYWCLALGEYPGSFVDGLLKAGKSSWNRLRAFGGSLQRGITLSPWALLVAASFAVLVFTRSVDLSAVPPEMTSDHVEKLINVSGIFQGMPYIFFANNGGREALAFYLIAFVSKAFGTGISFLSLKIVSVSAGILTLPFLYLLGREIADRRVGLLAMILGGIAYWPDMISRIGLRLPLAMLFCAATLYFFYKALRRRSWNDFLWSGVALGIGMYGYTPIRVVPLAMLVIAGLFLLHPASKGSRKWAVAGLLVSIGTAFLLFLPFLRYAVDFPEDFLLRTQTRILWEGATVSEVAQRFLGNISNAMQMFSWNDGVGWFNCVPLRPALDIVTGGLFHLGFLGIIVHAWKKRSWEALSIVLVIPILLLPSILALSFPNENPSLARAIAAVPAVFLLPALALVLLLDYLRGLLPGTGGIWAGAVFSAALIAVAAAQDFDLTLRQYPETYRLNSENASELGTFMRRFVDTIGAPEDAYLVPYPYWVDDRIMNIEAGFPIQSKHYLFSEEIPDFIFGGRPTLFLLFAEDTESLEALLQKFPDGYYARVVSSYPGNDFIYFIVPGVMPSENP
jgi:hypothetical protein